MKKFLLFLLIPMMLGSCQSSQQEPVPLSSDIRTSDEAISIALRSKATFYNRPASRAEVSVVRYQNSRANDKDIYYIVNFDNEQGYAIIPADKHTPELIAITEEGSLYSLTANENPGLQMLLDAGISTFATGGWPDTIPTVELPGTNPFVKQLTTVDTIWNTVVEPRLKTKWAQSPIEGRYMANGVAGCANTANAQIMSYFKSPTSIALDFNNRPSLSTSLDWDNMIKHGYQCHFGHSFCNASEQAHTQIACLCAQLAKDADSQMKYAPDGNNSTSTRYDKAINALKKHLKGVQYLQRDNLDQVYQDIKKGPIFMCGTTSQEGSHAWVVDGGMVFTIVENVYHQKWNDPEPVLVSHSSYTNSYLHINWGWGGHSNGYFSTLLLDPDRGYKYDELNDHYNYSNPEMPYNINVKYTVIYK